MSSTEIRTPLSYEPLYTETRFEQPDTGLLAHAFMATDFDHVVDPTRRITSFSRGSTAVRLKSDGSFDFRAPKSDIDIASILVGPDRTPTKYHIAHVDIEGKKREIDVMYFTYQTLLAELDNPYKAMLSSKLAHPGIAIEHNDHYDRIRQEVYEAYIVRGSQRQQKQRVTPSGASKLVIEENLWSEFWRWLSWVSYVVENPQKERTIAQLYTTSAQALLALADQGIATEVTSEYVNPKEPIYEIDQRARYGTGVTSKAHDRLVSIYYFVADHIKPIPGTNGGFNIDNAVRASYKLANLVQNPTISYSADRIFNRR